MAEFGIVESWDWSGAGTAAQLQPGLARATWYAGDTQIERASRFSRRAVLERLQLFVRLAADKYGVLVALDFPFSFPFFEKNQTFIDGSTTWMGFSRSVHAALDPDGRASELYGGPASYGQGGYADHFAHLNQGATNRGPLYAEAYRATERNAAALGCNAACVFRLVNPMVGVQALAGVHLLRTLIDWCVPKRLPMTVWPLGQLDRNGEWVPGAFDWQDPGLILVESYPRVSYQRAGVVYRELDTAQDVQRAVANLGSLASPQAVQLTDQTDDEQDALMVLLHLLSPAWYRVQLEPTLLPTAVHLAGNHAAPPLPTNLAGPGTPLTLLPLEGNIFGV